MKKIQKRKNLITSKTKREIAYDAKEKARAFVSTEQGVRLLQNCNVITPGGLLRERRNIKFSEALLPLFPGITGMVAEQLYRELLLEQQKSSESDRTSQGRKS